MIETNYLFYADLASRKERDMEEACIEFGIVRSIKWGRVFERKYNAMFIEEDVI